MKYSEHLRLLEDSIVSLENEDYDKAKELVNKADVGGYCYHKIISAINLKNADVAINSIKAEIREWEEMKYYDD